MILIGDTTDPFAPAAVKASMGSLFAVDLAHARDPGEFFDWARDHRIDDRRPRPATRTRSTGAPPIHAPVAILLGNEGNGLPRPTCWPAATAVSASR